MVASCSSPDGSALGGDLIAETEHIVFHGEEFVEHLRRVAATEDDLPR